MPTSTSTRCTFGPITVEYDARVLTPRPWTLAQSVWAAELTRILPVDAPLLELCAGAGHIGLAAAVLADRALVQVELDPVAAAYAAANARRAGWGERVEIRVADLQTALRPGELFPLIIADPPYLPSTVTARWPEDPLLAIDGGSDGLDLVRACLAVADEHLTVEGCLLLQVAGAAQAAQVEDGVKSNPLWSLCVREVREIDPERAVLRVTRPLEVVRGSL